MEVGTARIQGRGCLMETQEFIASLEREWATESRWDRIKRPYSAADVYRLRGTVPIEYTLAKRGAARLWQLLQQDEPITALSAITGAQAVQCVRAGLKSIYCSGWQVAGDMNTAQHTYPDQSLYPADSVPHLVRRINNALLRADQIHHMQGDHSTDWLPPAPPPPPAHPPARRPPRPPPPPRGAPPPPRSGRRGPGRPPAPPRPPATSGT